MLRAPSRLEKHPRRAVKPGGTPNPTRVESWGRSRAARRLLQELEQLGALLPAETGTFPQVATLKEKKNEIKSSELAQFKIKPPSVSSQSNLQTPLVLAERESANSSGSTGALLTVPAPGAAGDPRSPPGEPGRARCHPSSPPSSHLRTPRTSPEHWDQHPSSGANTNPARRRAEGPRARPR